MENYKVDIVIPVFRPDEKFTKLIEKLKVQTYPINQIIVMNTKSGIFPAEECRSVANMTVHHIEKEEFDHGGTRHQAASMSDSDIIIFMTQDAVPLDQYLVEQLVSPFTQKDIGAVYGRQLPDDKCRLIERYTREFNYPPKSCIKSIEDLERLGIKTFFCPNVCAAYRKEAYDRLGGFVTNTIFNEDMIFAAKLIKGNWKIAYAAGAQVIHSHNYGNIQQFKRNFDLAVSQKDHPEVFAGVKSETEGVKLVKQTAKYVIKAGKPWLILDLIVKSGFKYLGYKAGMNYKRLPKWLIYRWTMNQGYWKNKQ